MSQDEEASPGHRVPGVRPRLLHAKVYAASMRQRVDVVSGICVTASYP
jgi:hypothetical protein